MPGAREPLPSLFLSLCSSTRSCASISHPSSRAPPASARSDACSMRGLPGASRTLVGASRLSRSAPSGYSMTTLSRRLSRQLALVCRDLARAPRQDNWTRRNNNLLPTLLVRTREHPDLASEKKLEHLRRTLLKKVEDVCAPRRLRQVRRQLRHQKVRREALRVAA